MRPVFENARRRGSAGPNWADKPHEISPEATGGMQRTPPSEVLLILMFSVVGVVSLLAGVFVNEGTGTLLLVAGAIVVGWSYDSSHQPRIGSNLLPGRRLRQ